MKSVEASVSCLYVSPNSTCVPSVRVLTGYHGSLIESANRIPFVTTPVGNVPPVSVTVASSSVTATVPVS
jgi:hypothetical protein